MTKRYDNNIILAYSCLHLPFQDKRAFDFLADINRDYKPDRVISLGDDADHYTLSRYPKDPSALSLKEEIKKLTKETKTLGLIFPKMDIMLSNHLERLYSKATVGGIPREFIKPYKEIIGAPSEWRWYKSLSITVDKTREKIYFVHDPGPSALNLAKSIAMNVVAGHLHSSMGLQYFANPLKEMFAAQVGCLISDQGVPFEYNKRNVYRPLKGALIIIDGIPNIIRLC